MDLDKIINEHTNFTDVIERESAKDCMKIAIRQALELACERARVKIHMYENTVMENASIEVNKESIMSIMDEL